MRSATFLHKRKVYVGTIWNLSYVRVAHEHFDLQNYDLNGKEKICVLKLHTFCTWIKLNWITWNGMEVDSLQFYAKGEQIDILTWFYNGVWNCRICWNLSFFLFPFLSFFLSSYVHCTPFLSFDGRKSGGGDDNIFATNRISSLRIHRKLIYI